MFFAIFDTLNMAHAVRASHETADEKPELRLKHEDRHLCSIVDYDVCLVYVRNEVCTAQLSSSQTSGSLTPLLYLHCQYA